MLFAYIGAGLFISLCGTANILFALDRGADPVTTAFWVVLAVASTSWTVAGFHVVSKQWAVANKSRACAAALLLCLALSYDVLAAYGLARSEQIRTAALAGAYATSLAGARSKVGEILGQLAALPPGALETATAQLQASGVSDAQCASVIGPNKLRKYQADRIRGACRARTAALAALGASQARERLETALRAAQGRLAALEAKPPRTDARSELLPAGLVAWFPVLLITCGGLLCFFAVAPAGAAPKRETTPDEPVQVDEPPTDVGTPVAVADEAEQRVIALVATPRAPLRKEGAWVAGTQRAFGQLIGVNATRVNKILRDLARRGLLELDTTGRTTQVRLAKS